MEYRKIGDFCTVKGGKRLPKGDVLTNQKTNHPYLRISDFENNFINKDNVKFITEEVYQKIKNYIINEGDIFLSIVGTIGLVDVIGKKLDNSNLTENAVKIRSNNESYLKTEYLYYYLKSPQGQREIKIRTVGSTQPKLAIARIRDIPVPIKNIHQQHKIIDILSSIDNKIRLNSQLIANLEELSQVLFKRWFVDFEFPNENGTPYKSNNGIMKESVLGKIPNDWNVSALENIAENYNSLRKPLSKLEREKQENNFPYYGATKVIDYVEDYIFDGKYILVGEDGTVITNKKSPYTQYVSGKFWVSNHAHILKGKEMSDELLLLNLNNINISPFITGAVQPKLNKKNLNSIRIVKAPKNTQNQFEKVIEPIFEKIRSLKDEIIYLTQLRDTLLPKLMSGEIELPDNLEVTEDAELLQRG